MKYLSNLDEKIGFMKKLNNSIKETIEIMRPKRLKELKKVVNEIVDNIKTIDKLVGDDRKIMVTEFENGLSIYIRDDKKKIFDIKVLELKIRYGIVHAMIYFNWVNSAILSNWEKDFKLFGWVEEYRINNKVGKSSIDVTIYQMENIKKAFSTALDILYCEGDFKHEYCD